MNLVAETGLYGRVMGWLAVLGFLMGVLVYVPSPLSLFGSSPVAHAPTLPKVPALQLQDVPALEAYDEITARPLFNPERKPYADASSAAGATQAGVSALGDLSQYRLEGVVRAGDVQLAMIRKVGGPVLTVKPGDSLDGWSVGAIGPEGVTLSGGGREQQLAIPKATNSGRAP